MRMRHLVLLLQITKKEICVVKMLVAQIDNNVFIGKRARDQMLVNASLDLSPQILFL
jgi:hypothetical protein